MKATVKKSMIAGIETAGKIGKNMAIGSFIATIVGYILCIILDISEKKEFEERMNNNNNK